MSRLWPIGESAQADYEALRAAALEGTPLVGVAAARFESAGLFGLIRRPVAEAAFAARVIGARRPPWTPYGDPRLDALAEVYEFIVGAAGGEDRCKETGS